MIRLSSRALMYAAFLYWILPLLPGSHFSGGFWLAGLGCGLVMSTVGCLFICALLMFTVDRLVLRILLFLPCFWLIPAIELQVMAHWLPNIMTFDDWSGPIISGLILGVPVPALDSSLWQSAS